MPLRPRLGLSLPPPPSLLTPVAPPRPAPRTPGRVALDGTLPPDGFGLGARPSQLPQGFARGHRRLAVPLSRTTTSAVLSAIPSSAVTSPPATWGRRCRASKVTAFSLRRRPR